MRRTTIRELKHDMTKVLAWVAAGETVEIRRRQQLVAVLSPPRPQRRKKPDFEARLRSIYGPLVLSTTGTDLVFGARGET